MKKGFKIVFISAAILLIVVVSIAFKTYYDSGRSAVSFEYFIIGRSAYIRNKHLLYMNVVAVINNKGLSKIQINYVNIKIYVFIDSKRVLLGETIMEAPILKPGINHVNTTITIPLDPESEKYLLTLRRENVSRILFILDYSYTYGLLNIVKSEEVYSEVFNPGRSIIVK